MVSGRKKLSAIVLGTRNRDKLRELRSLLNGAGIRVLSLRDFPRCPRVTEDGRTFEANARKKARVYSRHTQMLTLADDSGLVVSHLKGKPGVYSARFAGSGCTYADNNEKLLRLLKGAPDSRRRAKFVCVAALYDRGLPVKALRGECRGKISRKPRGRNGFGYDPVFIPEGFSKTFAELPRRVKNKTSHRGKALRAAARAIRSYYAGA
ncbi:MAG: RdgB/HAM1 family non-canonical purine NTP pyrophosphatase [Candidatus Omnitrophica bacterium]|nr:RdgB/HAM1 family non-canonical purine NTP pyrophosphatase [Candidatus Omnitrophota bacterium]